MRLTIEHIHTPRDQHKLHPPHLSRPREWQHNHRSKQHQPPLRARLRSPLTIASPHRSPRARQDRRRQPARHAPLTAQTSHKLHQTRHKRPQRQSAQPHLKNLVHQPIRPRDQRASQQPRHHLSTEQRHCNLQHRISIHVHSPFSHLAEYRRSNRLVAEY